MDKRITLSKETVKKLKILAAHADTDVKNYIQGLVTSAVEDVYKLLEEKQLITRTKAKDK